MSEWLAPAKLNLDLRVAAADSTGMHPIRSLVQTLEWCDELKVEVDDEDRLEVVGASLPEGGDNLVWKAVDALDSPGRPRFDVVLTKHVSVAAGLGGGSSDAAAMLMAAGEAMKLSMESIRSAAPSVGADVPFFLAGGTALMEGYGERLTSLDALGGFTVAVAVPPFELSTGEVYRRWDDMDRPLGAELPPSRLPPGLRSFGALRNDLTPAARRLRPELADWTTDLSDRWERPVVMSGSGPAHFGFFLDFDEATSAVGAVGDSRATVAAELRRRGVARRVE